MAEERKEPPIPFRPLAHASLSGLNSVEALRGQVAAAAVHDPWKSTVVSEEVAANQYAAYQGMHKPTNDPTLKPKPAPSAFTRGGTYWHKKRNVRVTIVACNVRRTENDKPMHQVIDEFDNSFLAQEAFLEKR